MNHQTKISDRLLVYFCLMISCYLLLLFFSDLRFYLKMQDRLVEEIRCEEVEKKKMIAKIDELIQLIEKKEINPINHNGLETLKDLKERMKSITKIPANTKK